MDIGAKLDHRQQRIEKMGHTQILQVINRDFSNEEVYLRACMKMCRALGLELKGMADKHREKHLARFLAGYWRPRAQKRHETQFDAYQREQEEETAQKLLRQFDPAAKASSEKARLWFQFLAQCRKAPVKECQKVLGPQFWRCSRCGKAFFAETRRRFRRYCGGGRCGWRATATECVAKKRNAEHAARLKRAAVVLKSIAPGLDLKERLASKIGVQAKSITRWVNSGALKVPARLRADLYPIAATKRQSKGAREAQTALAPHALPTSAPVKYVDARTGRLIATTEHRTTEPRTQDTVLADRNAIRYLNHLLKQLAFDPKPKPTRVRFEGKVVTDGE